MVRLPLIGDFSPITDRVGHDRAAEYAVVTEKLQVLRRRSNAWSGDRLAGADLLLLDRAVPVIDAAGADLHAQRTGRIAGLDQLYCNLAGRSHEIM